MYIPTEAELAELLKWAMEGAEKGKTHFPDMTYEDGIVVMIDWLQGTGSFLDIKGE